MRPVPLCISLCFFLGFAPILAHAEFAGKVVGVIDGDSIRVMHDGKAEQIRLAGINCPERKPPFGTKAKQATSALSFGKVVTVEPVTKDRYGRTVARVSLPDGMNLNRQSSDEPHGMAANHYEVLPVRPRNMFDTIGKPMKLTELDANEAAAIEAFEISEQIQSKDETGELVKRTYKVKFMDRLNALALLGKACHYYADRPEQTGPDGGPTTKNITVSFVEPPISPEEAYRRMRNGS